MKAIVSVLSGLLILFGASFTPSEAVSIQCGTTLGSGTPGGDCSGTLTYVADATGTSATLTIQLDNDTPGALGASLTGLAFDNALANVAASISTIGFSFTASESDGDMGWALINLGSNTINPNSTPAMFDLGASTSTSCNNGSNCFNGGNVARGVEIGEGVTWTFTFVGTGLGLVTEADWVNPNIVDDSTGLWGVVRFQGFVGDGSSVVPLNATQTPIPEPATLLLLGSGLVGIGLGSRRLRRKK